MMRMQRSPKAKPEIRCNNNFYFHTTIASSFNDSISYPLHCLFLSILVFRNWGNRFAWRAKTQIIPDCPLFDDCYYSSVVFISESNGALSKLMTLKILIFKLLVPLGSNLNWKYLNRAVMKFEFEKPRTIKLFQQLVRKIYWWKFKEVISLKFYTIRRSVNIFRFESGI